MLTTQTLQYQQSFLYLGQNGGIACFYSYFLMVLYGGSYKLCCRSLKQDISHLATYLWIPDLHLISVLALIDLYQKPVRLYHLHINLICLIASEYYEQQGAKDGTLLHPHCDWLLIRLSTLIIDLLDMIS